MTAVPVIAHCCCTGSQTFLPPASFIPHCVCATKRLMASITVIKLSEDEVPGAKFKGKYVEEHTNIQLKRWLECRGLKKSGKRTDLL